MAKLTPMSDNVTPGRSGAHIHILVSVLQPRVTRQRLRKGLQRVAETEKSEPSWRCDVL